MLKDDPLSRLEMTNNCLWKVLSKLALLAPKLLLTSGGGYNPGLFQGFGLAFGPYLMILNRHLYILTRVGD